MAARSRRGVIIAIVGVLIVTGALLAGRALWTTAKSALSYDHCDVGSYEIDPDQAATASTMVGAVTSYQPALPERAAVLVLAAGLQESKLRNLTVVSREGQAAYRVRSYLAAQVIKGRTAIAWVWDVYDRDQQRTVRLSGEEPTGKSGRDAWTTVDDLTWRKIAQAGFSGLTSVVNGTPSDAAPPASPAPGKTGPAIAEAEPASIPGHDGIAALGYTDH